MNFDPNLFSIGVVKENEEAFFKNKNYKI